MAHESVVSIEVAGQRPEAHCEHTHDDAESTWSVRIVRPNDTGSGVSPTYLRGTPKELNEFARALLNLSLDLADGVVTI